MRLYDSHCHVDALEDIAGALRRAQQAGVEKILVPGVDPSQWARAAALPSFDGVELRFAIGVHPCAEPAAPPEVLQAAVDQYEPVAIGEFGWHQLDDGTRAETQTWRAESHLKVAATTWQPIILHVVGWHTRALKTLRAHQKRSRSRRGVVHAYSGSAEQVREYCALGLSISFGPSVLRENARRPLEAARATPPEHLLVETDAPDQHPPGKSVGEPADLRAVVEAVARARNESPAHVAKLTFENATRLFG